MHYQEGDAEPAHHARRPMNAFLIFCKRHRGVVRDKYPNLENRSITKILGEWWANLDKEEKACYTGLAKQYKDAFFSANPDFKWYKLPAPPLRSVAKPKEIEKPVEPTTYNVPQYTEFEKTNNNSTKVDLNKKARDWSLSMFTPGKLADEAHMGGLSSLLERKTEIQTPNPYYSPPCPKFNAISTPNESRSHSFLDSAKSKPANKEENIQELQDALSETTKLFEEELEEKGCHRNGQNEFTNQDVIDQIVNKRYSREDDYGQRNWSDDEKNSKSDRSCKGKRYQEFMSVGGLIANKRQRRDYRDKSPDEGYSATSSWVAGNEESPYDPKNFYDDVSNEVEVKNDSEAPEPDNNVYRKFKAADFDLEAKIQALPSLSLEKFQQRKKENKRRKRTIDLKPKVLEPSHIVNSVPDIYDERRETTDSWRETVIGSQKRKPRKISITRLEINSMVTKDQVNKISPEIKIATEAPSSMQCMEICRQPSENSDLLALATLAEVAANTSKLDSPQIGEGNPSEV